MLPHRAISLIHEYSKLITSPHWRCVAPHANLIIESPIMQNINQSIEDVLQTVIYKHYNKNDTHAINTAE